MNLKKLVHTMLIVLTLCLNSALLPSEKCPTCSHNMDEESITVDGKKIHKKPNCISNWLKKHAVCDYDGNWHLFKKKTDDNPYNFDFSKPEGTRIPNLKENINENKPFLKDFCASCLSKPDNDAQTGEVLLANIYEALQAKINNDDYSKDSTAKAIANKLYTHFTQKTSQLSLYGQTITGQRNVEKAQERFADKYREIAEKINTTKEKAKKTIKDQAQLILFDDLCAAGLMFHVEPGVGPQARPANLKALWNHFKTKQFCLACLENMTNHIGTGDNSQPIWNIQRPQALGSPHFGGTISSGLLSLLKMLSLSNIEVGEFATQNNSFFFEGPQKNYPARCLEKDGQWAMHYKMQSPDQDPALEFGFSKKDYFGVHANSYPEMVKKPFRFVKNNIIPILFGVATTALNTDIFDKDTHTFANLKKGLWEVNNPLSAQGWGSALDLFILASNIFTPAFGLPQTRANYSRISDTAGLLGRFALGRGLAPTVLAQSLGASGGLTGFNFAGNLLFSQNKNALLLGQSLGLALNGHLAVGAASLALPVLLGPWLEPSQKFEHMQASGLGLPFF